uniref:50S ribosomal protein L21, chloroplastic n=1 Tax=Bangiopsis subsimplex TaxID=139980 RepID=A0A1C9CCN9_9RHOD|nr:ribosomal protein L21 [Bangiopsis subsimplex]AOM66161.1 ribosomal protein L21 [Bangiopsis subsimplex]ARO90479.1 50S ribosomal protein L21 [Bangiopsis subsimplex]
MKYAIIEAAGKQFWIELGRFYDLNRLAVKPGDKILFKRVLLVKDGDYIEIGQPCVENISVKATVVRHLKGKKIIVFKRKPKKNTSSKNGHKQPLTRVMIDEINMLR